MNFRTPDLCEEFEESVRVTEPLFRDYGDAGSFCGPKATVRVFEDNVLVRETLETEGRRRVLVVNGGGSPRCALIGERHARFAYENGWAGVVINGCIRDSEEISKITVGVKALHIVPKRSSKEGVGERDVPVSFAGVTFAPGHYLYADADGIMVADRELLP
ncbi:MAG TPA: ribonuclease E activity regulator RraA [Rubrobacteraceae bacterium]